MVAGEDGIEKKNMTSGLVKTKQGGLANDLHTANDQLISNEAME